MFSWVDPGSSAFDLFGSVLPRRTKVFSGSVARDISFTFSSASVSKGPTRQRSADFGRAGALYVGGLVRSLGALWPGGLFSSRAPVSLPRAARGVLQASVGREAWPCSQAGGAGNLGWPEASRTSAGPSCLAPLLGWAESSPASITPAGLEALQDWASCGLASSRPCSISSSPMRAVRRLATPRWAGLLYSPWSRPFSAAGC